MDAMGRDQTQIVKNIFTNDVLYQLSYCGEPFKIRVPAKPLKDAFAEVISGAAALGKTNA